MSLRAIKKRETQYQNTNINRATLFKKATTLNTTIPLRRSTTTTTTKKETKSDYPKLKFQQKILGRLTRSNPELPYTREVHKKYILDYKLTRSKSTSDLNAKDFDNQAVNTLLTNAKSEIYLQSISAHIYTEKQNQSGAHQSIMLSGARSHRDLSQSAYAGQGSNCLDSATRRRLSECSMNFSVTGSLMSTSELTLSCASTTCEPNSVLRVPIIGYEVMEERARFTVYKLRVENPTSNDCWLVLRRYTDFARLNNKLKQLYPQMQLLLPRKKLFGDNFNAGFLDNRVQGLQIFVNTIMSKEELRTCKLVREFFCLDEPPTYSESMEECRAIFEAQEETITHLKLQIQNKNDLILSLQQKLRDEIAAKEELKAALKNLTLNNNTSTVYN